MHLLNTSTASLDDAVEPIDLRQPPACVLVLSFSDSDLIALSRAVAAEGNNLPSVRLTHLKHLRHPMSVDLWIDHTARHARVIVIRLLGGLDWWRYGIERLQAIARTHLISLAILPGEGRDDPRLGEASTLPAPVLERMLAYFRQGGPDNMRALLRLAAPHAGIVMETPPPAIVGPAGAWFPERGIVSLDLGLKIVVGTLPVVPILFYRSALLADDLQPVSALYAALAPRGIAPLPLFVTSLKDERAVAFVRDALARCMPAAIVTMTAFAAGSALFDTGDAPVLQVAAAVTRRNSWAAGSHGTQCRRSGDERRAARTRRPRAGRRDRVQGHWRR